MAAPAVHEKPPPASHSMPAVASGAIRHLLDGRRRSAALLGVSSLAWWIDVADDVIVVGTRGAVRLPNGVEVAGPLPPTPTGLSIEFGAGRIRLGSKVLHVARWWWPRPTLPAVAPYDLARAAAGMPVVVSELGELPLGRAFTELDSEFLTDVAEGLVGLGEGLTPIGDDYLAAAVAAFRLASEATGFGAGEALIDSASSDIAELARIRTTSLSASLIRHAVAGNVAAPVGALMRALAGRGDVTRAVKSLERVGHTSGRALVAPESDWVYVR